MDELFLQEVEQYTAEVGHQPTDADIDRLITELEDDMEVEYE